MSQEDTYRPAVLPSEAVMMPAVEETPEAPPPAVQEMLYENNPAMMPAKTRTASITLEKLRNRMRGIIPEGSQWVSTSQVPIDRNTTRPEPQRQASAPRAPQTTERPTNRTSITNGSALTTLMRSAARQYTPAPKLTQPQTPHMSMDGHSAAPVSTTSQPQMRGALRHVVRSAQSHPTRSMYPSNGQE